MALRCPACGECGVQRGWFTMKPKCENCGIIYEREPGFFLGSIYFNYGLTSLMVAIVIPILLFQQIASGPILIGSGVAFALLFPLLFFPWARSLWLGFDEYCDPRDGGSQRPSQRRAST